MKFLRRRKVSKQNPLLISRIKKPLLPKSGFFHKIKDFEIDWVGETSISDQTQNCKTKINQVEEERGATEGDDSRAKEMWGGEGL